MSLKFAVGQSVKITGNVLGDNCGLGDHDFDIDKIVTVVETFAAESCHEEVNHYNVEDENGDTQYIHEDELEDASNEAEGH